MKKESVVLTNSKLKMAILQCMQKAGYIESVTKKGKKVVTYLEVVLAYDADGRPKVSEAKRMSKSSKRVYMGAKDIRPVRNGYGIMILSTPKGILTGEDARKESVGGEALLSVW